MEYPCHKLPKDKWCDKHGASGFMGHTCLPTQKRSDKDHRPQITRQQVQRAVNETTVKLFDRLDNDKGWGTWLSRHEILGFLTEESYEVKKAVHEGTLSDVADELKDVVVGCIFALACIRADKLDW